MLKNNKIKSWKPNIFTPTFGNFLIKKGFKKYEDGKYWIRDYGFRVETNYKKRKFIFTFPNGLEKIFKTQTELREYIINSVNLC